MDTATWENDEVGAYVRLLFYEWINKGIPNDTYKMAKIVRESEKKFKKKWILLSAKFHPDGTGLLINDKLEFVRLERAQFIESQREKGKKSAKKRWPKEVTGAITTVEPVLQPDCNLSSSSSFSLNNKDLKEGENAPFELPTKEQIEEASEPMLHEIVDRLSIKIYEEKFFPEVFAFKNRMNKEKKNPRAILHTLIRAYMKREFEESPWAYCIQVMKIEEGKYNARDYGKVAPAGPARV